MKNPKTKVSKESMKARKKGTPWTPPIRPGSDKKGEGTLAQAEFIRVDAKPQRNGAAIRPIGIGVVRRHDTTHSLRVTWESCRECPGVPREAPGDDHLIAILNIMLKEHHKEHHKG